MTGIPLTFLIALPAVAVLLMPGQATAAQHQWCRATVAVWLVCGISWIVAASLGLTSDRAVVDVADVVELDSSGAAIAMNVDLSPIRVGLLLSGLLLAVPILFKATADCLPTKSDSATRRSYPAPLRLSAAILVAGAGALLTGDLVVLVALWLLLDTLVIQFAGVASPAPGTSVGRERQSSGFLIVLRLTSVALLAAVLLVVARYGTTSLSEFVSAALSDSRVDADVVRGGIVVWFALAVAGRAAMFPATIWLRSLTESTSRNVLPMIVWATVLPAVGLWLSLTPLLSAAGESSLLIATLGILSGVMVGTIALVSSPRETEPALLFVAVILGLVSLISASVSAIAGLRAPDESALVATMNSVIGLAAVGVLAGSPRHRITRTVAVLIPASGIGGTTYALGELVAIRQHVCIPVEQALEGVGSTAPAGLGAVTGLWWAVCVLQFLLGAAIAHMLFHDDDRASETTSNLNAGEISGWLSRYVAPLTVGTALVTWFALGAIAARHGSADESAQPFWTNLLTLNAATPAGLLGCLSVWLFDRAPNESQQRLRHGLATFERLARNWFYVGDIAARLGMPLQWLAALIEFLDRHVIAGIREDAWSFAASRFGRAIEDVDEHGPAYSSLAAVLALGGLLLALAGLSG